MDTHSTFPSPYVYPLMVSTKQPELDVKNTLILISAEFGIRISDIIGKSKVQHIKQARWLFWKILRKEGYTLDFCGKCTGGHDHTTVLNALSKIDDDIKLDKKLAERWNRIKVKMVMK